MAVASPYYRHFRRCLDLSYPTSTGEMLRFHSQPMSTDFPQYSDYDRVKELVRNDAVMVPNPLTSLIMMFTGTMGIKR